MLKSILELEGAQKLTKAEQKEINGGKSIGPGSNCHCFCHIGTSTVSNSCFSYCPDGKIPGLSEGSTGDCTFQESPGGI
jgi:hypothetical protein